MTASRNRSAQVKDERQSLAGVPAADLAGYIEDMVREMEGLACGPKLERLRDLLRLARKEANRAARG